jgi:hypothetical protein
VFGGLPAGTRLVFLRPIDDDADRTIRIADVEARLSVLTAANELDLTVLRVPDGTHASAVRNADEYNALINIDRRTW